MLQTVHDVRNLNPSISSRRFLAGNAKLHIQVPHPSRSCPIRTVYLLSNSRAVSTASFRRHGRIAAARGCRSVRALAKSGSHGDDGVSNEGDPETSLQQDRSSFHHAQPGRSFAGKLSAGSGGLPSLEEYLSTSRQHTSTFNHTWWRRWLRGVALASALLIAALLRPRSVPAAPWRYGPSLEEEEPLHLEHAHAMPHPTCKCHL